MPFAPALEVREQADGKKLIRGYALKFGVRSQLLYDFFYEEIAPGALDETRMDDVLITLNHNFDKLLGRTTSKTLRLQRDDTGLFYEVEPPNTEAGREALELISRGDITGSSFIFELAVDGDKWTSDEEGRDLRIVRNIKRIYEVGPVVNPAYLDTEAEVAKRSLEAYKKQIQPEQRFRKEYHQSHLDLVKRKIEY